MFFIWKLKLEMKSEKRLKNKEKTQKLREIREKYIEMLGGLSEDIKEIWRTKKYCKYSRRKRFIGCLRAAYCSHQPKQIPSILWARTEKKINNWICGNFVFIFLVIFISFVLSFINWIRFQFLRFKFVVFFSYVFKFVGCVSVLFNFVFLWSQLWPRPRRRRRRWLYMDFSVWVWIHSFFAFYKFILLLLRDLYLGL